MVNIQGRKGGGGNAQSPKESPDSLHSVATAKILLALGEGECAGGLTDKDIYLDGTPVRAQDGTLNFPGVTWEYRPGTQAQEYIQGIPSVENEISINTPLKQTQPWTRAISNTQLSALRIRLGLSPYIVGPGWSDFGSGNSTLDVIHNGYKIELKGLISAETGVTGNIMTLPEYLRPTESLRFTAYKNTGGARGTCLITISASGIVSIDDGTAPPVGSYVSLDGIGWRLKE